MNLAGLVEEGIRKFGEYEACYLKERGMSTLSKTVKLG